jgi:hypothetical protein
MDKTVTHGRIVHYMLNEITSRPAVIAVVNPGEPQSVNLQVFIDGTNDVMKGVSLEEAKAGTAWRTSVHYSETWEKNTWHWPMDSNPSLSKARTEG